MMTYDEIDVLPTDLLNSLTVNNTQKHKFCDLIRFLKKARSTLKGLTDEEARNAKRVITAHARVQRWIVTYTDLRQEQEIKSAIELLTEKIEQADHLEN